MNNTPNQDGLSTFDSGVKPENYLLYAVLCTALCCLPFGIVSIIKSSEVDSKWAAGDYDGARNSSKEALKYAKWGAIAGGVPIVLMILFYVFMLVFGFSMSLLNGF